MNLELHESTYSTLSNPLLESLSSSEKSKGTQYQNDIKLYRNFLESLKLQHHAYSADIESTKSQTSEIESQLASMQQEYDQQGKVIEALKSEVDTQRSITSLAKSKFASPVELDVDGKMTYVTLNKTVAQLEEDHQFLEEQLQMLDDQIAKETVQLDRQIALSTELQEVVNTMKDRILSGGTYTKEKDSDDESGEHHISREGSEAPEH